MSTSYEAQEHNNINTEKLTNLPPSWNNTNMPTCTQATPPPAQQGDHQSHPDYSDIVAEVLPPELCPNAHLLTDLQHLRLPLKVAKGATGSVPGCRQAIQVPAKPDPNLSE